MMLGECDNLWEFSLENPAGLFRENGKTSHSQDLPGVILFSFTLEVR